MLFDRSPTNSPLTDVPYDFEAPKADTLLKLEDQGHSTANFTSPLDFGSFDLTNGKGTFPFNNVEITSMEPPFTPTTSEHDNSLTGMQPASSVPDTAALVDGTQGEMELDTSLEPSLTVGAAAHSDDELVRELFDSFVDTSQLTAPTADTNSANDISPTNGPTTGGTNEQEPQHHQGVGEAMTKNHKVEQPADTTMHEVTRQDSPLQPDEVQNGGLEMEVVRQPTLLDKALEVLQKKKGPTQLNQGDVVIILDESNLRKTLRLDHTLVGHQMPNLHTEYVSFCGGDTTAVVPVGGVSILAVLRHNDKHKMSVLHFLPLDSPAPELRADYTSTTSATSVSEKALPSVKAEPGKEIVPQDVKPADTWVEDYDRFFRTLVFLSNISTQKCRLPSDAAAALVHVQPLIAIAEHYKCENILRSAFKSWTTDWNSTKTLYLAIAVKPCEWLSLAVALQSALVYNEAYVHIAGRFPVVDLLDSDGKPKVEPDVFNSIKSSSERLRYWCYDVDKQFDRITFGIEKGIGKGKETFVLGPSILLPVDPESHPDLWTLVNVWRDFRREHLAHIEAEPSYARQSFTCAHSKSYDTVKPECLTFAGLYRTIHRGGDAYMPAERIVEKMRKADPDSDAVLVRRQLALLKKEGTAIVAPLLKSNLQYDGRDKLPYLTCVKVDELPWKEEHVEDEDEDDGNLEDVEMT